MCGILGRIVTGDENITDVLTLASLEKREQEIQELEKLLKEN